MDPEDNTESTYMDPKTLLRPGTTNPYSARKCRTAIRKESSDILKHKVYGQFSKSKFLSYINVSIPNVYSRSREINGLKLV